MEAKVSYNDLKGTIAADIVDNRDRDYSLNRVFNNSDINFKQVDIVGFYYFNGLKLDRGVVNIWLLLQDKSNKTLRKKEVEVTIEKFFTSFKQLNFVLIDSSFDHSEISFDKIESLTS